MSDPKDTPASFEQTMAALRRFGWVKADGVPHDPFKGKERCVENCATEGHRKICVRGPSHDGRPHACVDCDK